MAELPGVGENFHNHVLTGVIQGTSQPVPPGNLNLSEAALFYKTDPAQTGPDIQMAFVHVPFDVIIGQANPNAVSILPGIVRPDVPWLDPVGQCQSTGQAADQSELSATDDDPQRLLDAVKLSRRIFATKAFSAWSAGNCCRVRRWRRMSNCAILSGSGRIPTITKPALARWVLITWP